MRASSEALSFYLPLRSGQGCPQLRASDEHSFIVRVLRARRAPGRSLLPLLDLPEVGCFQRLIRDHLVKRQLHTPLPLPIFQ